MEQEKLGVFSFNILNFFNKNKVKFYKPRQHKCPKHTLETFKKHPTCFRCISDISKTYFRYFCYLGTDQGFGSGLLWC